jgi:hypothetical protein
MSIDQQFNSVLQEIKEIYLFLTEGDPSPDDEIEAREQLLTSFNSLKTINPLSNHIGKIDKILEDLRNWDSLELWFSETALPSDIKNILGLPEKQKDEDSEKAKEEPELVEDKKNSEPEIDLTDIFNKVSDQFKDEIDNLKGKIDDLKKELEKKDETLKSVKEKKKVRKITPKREVKLPPPKIRIPVIKKPIPPPSRKPVDAEKDLESERPKEKSIQLEPVKPIMSTQNQKLTPIPSISNEVKERVPELIPIPTEEVKSNAKGDIIGDTSPPKTQKRRIMPIVSEIDKPVSEKLEESKVTKKTETPIISSVEVEEIETEEIKSSGTDLFNVLTSVGGKVGSTKTEHKKTSETKLTNPPPKMNIVEENANNIAKPNAFVNFGGSPQTEKTPHYTSGDELSDNKDTLYQELIALEGKRYSLEKSFKELDTLYNKGSIADSQYKNESDNLKTKLGEITSRIYKIRRIISSL